MESLGMQLLTERLGFPKTMEPLPGFTITSMQPHRVDEVSVYLEKGMMGDPDVVGLRLDILNTYPMEGCDTWDDVFASKVSSGWVRARFSGDAFSYVRANPVPRKELLECRFQDLGYIEFPDVGLEEAQEPVPYHRDDEHKIDTAGMTFESIQPIIHDLEDGFRDLFTSMNNYPVYRESGVSYNDYGKQIERTYEPTLYSSTASDAVIFPFFGRPGREYMGIVEEMLSLFGFDVEHAELTRSERRMMRNCVYNHDYTWSVYWGMERLGERFPGQLMVGVTTKHIPNRHGSPVLGRYSGLSDFIMLSTYKDYRPERDGGDFILPFRMKELTPKEVGGCLVHELGERFDVRKRQGFRDNHHHIGNPEFKVCLMTSADNYYDHVSEALYHGYPGFDPKRIEVDSYIGDGSNYLENGLCDGCRTTLEELLDVDLGTIAVSRG